MKEWYLRQTPRDRIIVIAVSVLALISLLYVLVWHPLVTRTATAERAIATKKENLAFIERAVPALSGPSGGNSGVTLDAELQKLETYQLVNALVNRQQLQPPPDRIEPAGSDRKGARVQFSTVPFDELVKVLAEIELYGFTISSMTITRKPKVPGTVSARFNVEPI